MPSPNDEETKSWLSQLLGDSAAEQALSLTRRGPIEALQLYQSGYAAQFEDNLSALADLFRRNLGALDFAAKLSKQEIGQSLIWLQEVVSDLIRYRTLSVVPGWGHSFPLEKLTSDMELLFQLYDKIGFYRKIGKEQINPQLALEELAIHLERAA